MAPLAFGGSLLYRARRGTCFADVSYYFGTQVFRLEVTRTGLTNRVLRAFLTGGAFIQSFRYEEKMSICIKIRKRVVVNKFQAKNKDD